MQSDTMLIREAAREDLAAVLSLYAHLHDADEKAGDRVLERICLEIPADPRTHLFILEYEGGRSRRASSTSTQTSRGARAPTGSSRTS